jgi:glycosyltransferase involved in cell wall biosynthesis
MRLGVGERLRILLAGWLNSPHVSAWVELVNEAGHDVHVVGYVAPGWPELKLSAPSHRLSSEWPPPLRGLHLSHALGRVARAIDPDLVHAHYLPEYGWMAARENLRPLISSAWGSDVLVARGINRRRSKLALKASALAFVDSAYLGEQLRTLARSDVRVEVVRWGLDLETFAPGDQSAARGALGISPDGPLVVGMRGLRRVYNPVLLLEAFAQVRARRPDARLLLKHPQAVTPNSVAAAIERLGLSDAVTVLGNLSQERLPDVYRAADVVVSIASSDSSPRSVWEALACGRPIVVSDLQWARDELEPGGDALLVSLDAHNVAAAIDRVLDDPALAERLGAAGRALAATELDPAICAARVDKLYRSVIRAKA